MQKYCEFLKQIERQHNYTFNYAPDTLQYLSTAASAPPTTACITRISLRTAVAATIPLPNCLAQRVATDLYYGALPPSFRNYFWHSNQYKHYLIMAHSSSDTVAGTIETKPPQLAGFIAYNISHTRKGALIIHWVCVFPEFRKHRIATTALRYMESKFLSRTSKLPKMLYARAESERESEFWTAQGYHIVATLDLDVHSTVYYMRKLLPPVQQTATDVSASSCH